MCDACSVKGVNWSLNNGPGKSELQIAKLFAYFDDGEVVLKLCYLCAVELFLRGETRFIEANPRLGSSLGHNRVEMDHFF